MFGITLSKKWKGKRAMTTLLLIELAGITASLALFGIAAPDTYRSRLWLAGGFYGYNSDPRMRIYYYANHKLPPTVPLIWSGFLTNWNVAISIVFMFALLIKSVLVVVKLCYPILSLGFHLIALGMWIFSLYGQLSPDYSDPKHPSTIPWYIRESCQGPSPDKLPPPGPAGIPKLGNIPHYCVLARSSLACTVIMVSLYLAYIIVALHSLFVRNSAASGKDIDNDSLNSDIPSYQPEPSQPKPEFIALASPRTQAFNRLDGNDSLPFRKYQSQN